jgi:hypothetical protein
MDQSIKEKWVEALRSGDYEQGQGALRQKDQTENAEIFCCLGVLCDIVEDEVEGEWSEWSDVTYQFVAYGAAISAHKDRSTEVLPRFVQKHADLGSEEPTVTVPDDTGKQMMTVTLTELNDGLSGFQQHSFDEIADAIERSL